jgi:transcriptional regulator with XRE-family HTH domain
VRERPVRFKELGEFFLALRTARGWTQSEAVRFARQRGHAALTRQVLLRLERGQTKNPEPEVLQAIAALYGEPYQRVLGRFLAQRYGIDIGEGAQVKSDSSAQSVNPDTLGEFSADPAIRDIPTAILEAVSVLTDMGDTFYRHAEALLTGHFADIGHLPAPRTHSDPQPRRKTRRSGHE